MKLYGPSGEEIGIEDFITIYSNDYFLKDSGKGIVPRLSRCSKYVECKIDEILHGGIGSEQDIARILAWKIGKIRHRDSEAACSFKYASDWENADQLEGVMLYQKPFDIKRIAGYVFQEKDKLEELAENCPQVFLNRLREENFEGIGTVYMITLLFFLSRGKYPIYDRFAMMALNAIEKGIQPKFTEKALVSYQRLPSKNSDGFKTVMANGMRDYMKKLCQIFGSNHLNDRRIDQALWVYGHLFQKK
jgi:hypothetical protein